MKHALQAVYGTSGDIENYHFGGSTDRDTVFYLMRNAGLSDEEIEAGFMKLPPIMEKHILAAPNIQACTGAHELVSVIESSDAMLPGIVTGNFQQSGNAKLIAAGFNPAVFPVGAYGHLSPDRADLPPAAVDAAYQLTSKRYEGEEIIIIGDTTKDIICGRSVGAKVIAVLTGYSDKAALAAEDPFAIIDDLGDVDAVIDLIMS